jgi:TRAP-type transport system periplasmic protein
VRVLWLVLAALLAACEAPAPPGVTVLTYASPYGPSHPFSRADRTWMSWVEAQSGGTLRIRAAWSGSLLSAEHSLTELRHGVADVGLITPIYARGGAHLLRVQTGFYSGATSFAQQVALYRCLAASEPQFARELQGLKVLAVQGGTLPGIIARDGAIRQLSDLSGLRLRAPAELLGVLRELGADPVELPMSETYSALAKGVLDGVIAPPDTFSSLHFAEVARYFNTIAIPRGAYPARAMSLRRWNTLSAAQRAVLERSVTVWEQALEAQLAQANRAGLARGQEQGITFLSLPAAEQARFAALYTHAAEVRARALARFGIDGIATFQRARALAAQLRSNDRIQCTGSGAAQEQP